MTTKQRLRRKLQSSWVDKSINERQIEHRSILFSSQLKIISDVYLYMSYIFDVNPSTSKQIKMSSKYSPIRDCKGLESSRNALKLQNIALQFY